MRVSNYSLNEAIETARKKNARKKGVKYSSLKGKPGSKIAKRLSRNKLRRDIYHQRMGIV